MLTFAEFFAGGGMARIGLGPGWRCVLANDNSHNKAYSYVSNFGKDHFRFCDVSKLRSADVPGTIDLAWSSAPCQDVSVAGARAGLKGKRSSAFWPWWRLIEELNADNRAPRTAVLENVPGLLSSNGGRDIAAVRQAFEDGGYGVEVAKIDAKHFVPQSRARVFVIGVRQEFGIDVAGYVAKAMEALPQQRDQDLADIVDSSLSPFTEDKAAEIFAMMKPEQLAKVSEARRAGEWVVGVYFAHTRVEGGVKIPRVEVRFNDTAYALRTAGGGSSREGLIAVKGDLTHIRLLSPRECARAMGLPDSYKLPAMDKDAWTLIGDGVSPPVVRHLAEHALEPILRGARL
jgi:DNA (cytosine-5)-methyltransferase 1